MIPLFQRLAHWRPFLALALSSGFAIGLLLLRVIMTGWITYTFLLWNLFLAWIPLTCAWLVSRAPRTSSAWKWIWLPALLWFLFFPNSPYILTDLGHLARITEYPNVPLGFDVVMILSFALNGLLLGFVSLFLMEHVWRDHFKSWIARTFSLLALFLAGFGMYLGRFLRWNSWDIFHRPLFILQDTWSRVADPLSHPRTWGFTFLYAGFLIAIYLTATLLKRAEKP